MNGDPAAASRSPARGARRRIVVIAMVLIASLVLLAAALVVFRYLPALDEARALRADLEMVVERVQDAGLGIDRATMDALDVDLASATRRHGALRSLLADDPLIGLARSLPPTGTNVRGADDVVMAAGHLLEAVHEGLGIGRRFIEIREAQAADPGTTSALSQLVELMATSSDRAMAAAASVRSARLALAAIPDGLVTPIESARDAMSVRIDKYGPILESYLETSARLPAILGWNGPRRYLVLTQDPAELRPTGGFIGSYGIITFDRGRISEHRFQAVTPLDFPWDYPVIKPPQALSDYLLGPKQPWQFADANWSPDFPTSARDAMRLYVNESRDTNIDGVIGVTTYTIDELLKVTGPVTVPDFEATIASGETTLKLLQLTRSAPTPEADRKAFLPLFADRLIASLVALPPGQWGDLLDTAASLRRGRLLLTWFPDPRDQELAVLVGFDGAVRQDPGDYVYPVESNVAPASKLNFWTNRNMDVSVQVDAVGNARTSLDVTWDNRVDTPEGETYRAMTGVGGRILGTYLRLLVPERSRVEAVSGGGLAPVTGPAVLDDEAGRMAIGTYLKIPPGRTNLRYSWTSPYAADADPTGGTYRLTIQAQPGMLPGPLNLSIQVPPGYRITAASPELVVSGATATLAVTFDRDIVVGVRYGK